MRFGVVVVESHPQLKSQNFSLHDTLYENFGALIFRADLVCLFAKYLMNHFMDFNKTLRNNYEVNIYKNKLLESKNLKTAAVVNLLCAINLQQY